MPPQPLIQPTPTITATQAKLLLETFNAWAAGRTGLTQAELIDLYATNNRLTPAQKKALEDKLKKPAPPAPAPTPTPKPAPPKPKITTKEQLKAEYEADLRELEQQDIGELKKLEEELKKEKEQLKAEYEADVRVLEQEGPEALQKLEEEEAERLTKEFEEEELRALKKQYRPEPTVPEELILEPTRYPKWWRDGGVAAINLTAPGSQSLVRPPTKGRLFIPTIVITVTDAVAITITFGTGGSSGPIYLGNTDQPKGIVIAMGNSPAPCGTGGLSITATDINATNPIVGGFATYYLEKE